MTRKEQLAALLEWQRMQHQRRAHERRLRRMLRGVYYRPSVYVTTWPRYAGKVTALSYIDKLAKARKLAAAVAAVPSMTDADREAIATAMRTPARYLWPEHVALVDDKLTATEVNNRQAELYAAAFHRMQVETASGAALDAIAGIPFRDANMSDAELRVYAARGYALRVEDTTPEQRAQRTSPPMTLFVPKLLQRADETDQEFVRRGLYQGVIHENVATSNGEFDPAALARYGKWDTGEACCDGSGCHICGQFSAD